MKAGLFLCLSLAAFFPVASHAQYNPAAYSDLNDSEAVSSLKGHVSYLCSPTLGGRPAGSEGETLAASYVAETLENYSLTLVSPENGDLFGIKLDSGDTLTSRNVVAFIPGYDKKLKDRYIVVGARLDGIPSRTITVDGEKHEVMFPGANAGASGLAMMMELSRMLSTSRPLLRRSVIVVAFGASQNTFAGSWYFLNRSFTDVKNIDAMVDLECLGTGNDGFYAYSASNKDMNTLVETLNSTLQPIRPEITAAQHFPSDQMAFYDAEIPSVMFTTGAYKEYLTPKDTPEILQYETMESELEYIYNFVVTLAGAAKPIFNVEEELKARASSSEGRDVVPYYDCDYKPAFLGNTDPRTFLEKWVYQYLKYPQSAVDEGVQGKVLVDFMIDEKGKVTDVKVLRGVDPRLDDEAIRVVSASPAWRPGYVRGKKVKSEMSVWVEFRLEKKKNKR